MTTGSLKPIQTRYKGHHFRSRLEARWAVFLDNLGVRWEYEVEGYDLGEAGPYLPDFRLPDLGCWVEVKPADADEDAVRKAQALRDREGSPVVIFTGQVDDGSWRCFATDVGHSSGGSSEWEVSWFICECGLPKLSWGDGCHGIVNGDTWARLPMWCTLEPFLARDECGPTWDSCSGFHAHRITEAVTAARSARFEHKNAGTHGLMSPRWPS